MNCISCGLPPRNFGQHAYRACGLSNVVIDARMCPCGQAVAIHDVDGLHRAIAAALLAAPGPLSAEAVRYLRKFVDGLEAPTASPPLMPHLRCRRINDHWQIDA